MTVAGAWARVGPWRALCGLAAAAVAKAFGLHVVLVNRSPHHASGDDVPEAIARRFDFRVLAPDEVRRFARDPRLQMAPDVVRSSLARGDYCFGVLDGRELAAYDWRGLRDPVPLNDDLDVQYAYPGQVYGYAMFTRPEYRGLRLQLYGLRRADGRLLAEGYTHTIGYVALENVASIRHLSRVPGQVFVGLAGYLRVGRHYVTFRTPGARRHGFRIARSRGAPSGSSPWC